MEHRPAYRHIVVQRKALVEHIDPEKLRRLRQQMESGQPIDPDLRHLVVRDTLKASVRKVLAWAGHADVPLEADDTGLDVTLLDEAAAREQRGDSGPLKYKRQEGVIVGRLVQDRMPGDVPGQALPSTPTYLFHGGFQSAEDRKGEFMRCAQELHRMFTDFSDRKFLLLDPDMRAGVTLVTVVLTPIVAIPRAGIGVELMCEFHQKTQFGQVSTNGFDVFSDTGEYPIQPPNDADLALMFMSSGDFRKMEAAQEAL